MNRYSAKFNLTEPVSDTLAAYKYLISDDMTKYLLADGLGYNKVTNIRWELVSATHGYILVDTEGELTEEESASISEWISGQCSDGLGEGFEQQDFAHYPCDCTYWTEDFWDENWATASFDWETNEYKLKKIR